MNVLGYFDRVRFTLYTERFGTLNIDEPVVNGLISKSILKINKQFGNSFIMSGMNASVSLMKRAEKLLKLSDIDLNENPTEDEIELIKNNRPSWTDKWNMRY